MSNDKKEELSQVNVSGAGAVAMNGSIAAGERGFAIGGSVRDIIIGKQPGKVPIPHQVPPLPTYYVERLEERIFREALLEQNADEPLLNLYGLSGTGKSSLAAHVIQNLIAEQAFPDGVLWGDLAKRTPNEQLQVFLGALDSKWLRSAPHEGIPLPLRDVFWQMLIDKCMLIVLDNVKETRQLEEILISDIARCRILVISTNLLSMTTIGCRVQRLSYFSESESLGLFEKLMGETETEIYKDILLDIGRHLENVPMLVVTAALNFTNGKIAPVTYLRTLRQTENQNKLLGEVFWDGLELALQGLTEDQVRLFELIGVLGEGDWNYNMLAAVALRRSLDVEQALDVLVNRGLVERIGVNRYRVNTLIREFIQNRLKKRDEYTIQAARNLLARYCLDIAQDLRTSLLARPDLRTSSGQATKQDDAFKLDEAIITAYRNGIMPEISHIRSVLDWAARCENWDIILRFSYLPYVGLIYEFAAYGEQTIRMNLDMVTVQDPIVLSRGGQARFFLRSVVGSVDKVDIDQSSTINDRCELELNISAGHLQSGIFYNTSLEGVRWIGVRASEIILKDTDLVGSSLMACDLSRSTWINCDARRVALLGSNMSDALLKDVRLRGANLRGLNLTGAILNRVDMRGADLRGANLSGTKLFNVKLEGCQLENVRWAGAEAYKVSVDDAFIFKEVAEAVKEQSNMTLQSAYRLLPDVQDMAERRLMRRNLSMEDLHEVDLRIFDLVQADLTSANLSGANLCAARLIQTDLHLADLSNAILRAADLSQADLPGANLSGADLRAANLTQADLTGVNLSGADLRTADLTQADLPGANLSGADLRHVEMLAFDLSNVSLQKSNLKWAHLSFTKLIGANLNGANLEGTDLSYADLSNASLSGAICTGTNFRDAKISEEQLLQTGHLGNAILPTGQTVFLMKDDDFDTKLDANTFLRFAHFEGTFKQLNLAGRDIFGGRFAGTFVQVDFTGAHLQRANLVQIKMQEANFTEANLAQANLMGMNALGIDFTNVHLQGANLSQAKLQEVNFTEADLSQANLEGADLSNANFRSCIVQDEQLEQAYKLRGATLPDGTGYDGRFNLAGDIKDAKASKVDPEDREAMAAFYSLSQIVVNSSMAETSNE